MHSHLHFLTQIRITMDWRNFGVTKQLDSKMARSINAMVCSDKFNTDSYKSLWKENARNQESMIGSVIYEKHLLYMIFPNLSEEMVDIEMKIS